MPSETFYCPHCKRQLSKSAQAYVLGEIIESKAPFMGLGEMAPFVTCPGCGGRIDSMKMIKGEYDYNSEDGWTIIMVLVIIASVLVLKLVLHWSWVAAVLAGLIGGALLVLLLSEIFKGKKKGGSIYY